MGRRGARTVHALVLSGALACPLAVGLSGAAAAPLTAVPQIETLLASGLGDGGPAAEALVNASRMTRAANGDLLIRDVTGLGSGYFYDAPPWNTAGKFRRITDGKIGTLSVPALPETARAGADIEDVHLRGAAAIYVLLDSNKNERRVVRVDSGGDRELVRGSTNNSANLLAVATDGSLVWTAYRYDPAEGGSYSTELVSPDGTTTRRLTDYTGAHAAIADDGTVFLTHYQPANAETGAGAGLGIERIRPDGAVDVVAGPGPAADRYATRADDVAATAAVISPRRIAVTPDGTRVAFADYTARGNYILRSFEVGGAIRTVAGSDAQNKSFCRGRTPALLAEPDGVLAACGGIRSFAHDGSASAAGTVVAGRNALPGLLDAPSGTPLSRAYLSRVRDLAYDPKSERLAIATPFGASVIDGIGDEAKLVQVLATGVDERLPESNGANYDHEVDIAYGPDGTLYMFTPDPADPTTHFENRRWRLRSLAPGAGASPVEVASGRGSTPPADGVVLANVALKRGRIGVSPDGTLYLTQAQTVYRLDGSVLRKVADVVEKYVPVIGRLGFDSAGRLLVAGAQLHRLDADGKLREIESPPPHGFTVGTDGSIYAKDWRKIWRQKPDGTTVVALGREAEDGEDLWYDKPTTPPVGADLGGYESGFTSIEALPDGRIAVADSAPTGGLMLVRPANVTWTAPAPTLTVTSASTNTASGPAGSVSVRVQVPSSGPAWRFRAHVTIGDTPPSLNTGIFLEAKTLQAGGAYETSFSRYDDEWVGTQAYPDTQILKPGQQVSVTLWAWVGDSSVGVPRTAKTITVPAPTRPTITLSGPRTVQNGKPATIRGVLRLSGAPLAGQPFAVQTRRVGSLDWDLHTNGFTDAKGGFAAGVVVTQALEVRAIHDVGFNQELVVASVRINPGYAVTARPQYSWRKQAVLVRGTVVPRGKGQPVILEQGRKRGGVWHWRVVDRSVVRAQGAFELTMPIAQQPTRTTLFFRVRVPKSVHADAGDSPRLRFSVPPKTG